MRPVLTFALALAGIACASGPAAAVDYTLLRWKKTGQCEIVSHVPPWGDHWIVLGQYQSGAEAEHALAKSRITRACPVAKWAKRSDHPLEERKPAITYRAPRTDEDRPVMFREWRPNTRR